ISSYLPEGQRRFISSTERRYIYGRIKERRLHLMNQGAVDVLDLNTALDETLRSLLDQAVVGVFRDRKIQSPLNGLSLRLRVQNSLGALNLGRVQLKVFVGSLGCCRHEMFPVIESISLCTKCPYPCTSISGVCIRNPVVSDRWPLCHIVAGVYTPVLVKSSDPSRLHFPYGRRSVSHSL